MDFPADGIFGGFLRPLTNHNRRYNPRDICVGGYDCECAKGKCKCKFDEYYEDQIEPKTVVDECTDTSYRGE